MAIKEDLATQLAGQRGELDCLVTRKTLGDLIAAGGSEAMADEILQAQQLRQVDVFGVLSTRVPYGDESMYAGIKVQSRCRDCGSPRGWLHVPSCVVEACPRCKVGQAFGCSCGTVN